jgi:hypothetical protein
VSKAHGLDHVVWIEKGWQPHHIGFCPSRKAWDKMTKKLGRKDAPYPHKDNPLPEGFCSTFNATKSTARCSVITLNKRLAKKWKGNKEKEENDRLFVLGIILHECVHAYQDVLVTMAEKSPGPEFEAYAVQCIFVRVTNAYIRWVNSK